MNFLLFPCPHSLPSPSCAADWALPDALPLPRSTPGTGWCQSDCKGWLHPCWAAATTASLGCRDCGAPLTAGMVAPGSTYSCSHHLHFQLLWAQAILVQGIPPQGMSPAQVWGVWLRRGGAETACASDQALCCLFSMGWLACGFTNITGFGRRKIPNFYWPPIFLCLKGFSLKGLSRRERFKIFIYLFHYSELNIVAKIHDEKQPGRRRCNKIQQELRLIMPIHWWTRFWSFSHIK